MTKTTCSFCDTSTDLIYVPEFQVTRDMRRLGGYHCQIHHAKSVEQTRRIVARNQWNVQHAYNRQEAWRAADAVFNSQRELEHLVAAGARAGRRVCQDTGDRKEQL